MLAIASICDFFERKGGDIRANTSAVYARIDTNLKNNAEEILTQLGISQSIAIQMLYSQIVLNKGLPFDLHLPTSNLQMPIINREQLDASRTHT